MALVLLPYMYVPDPTRGRPVFNGKIYIGEPDTDPTIIVNQKQSNLVQEDGTIVPAAYPIETNAGGIPTYNGSPVAIDVDGVFSLQINDRNDQQIYYYPINGADDNLLDSDLRSVMFDFGLLYSDVGTKLVTSASGTSLDDAILILNISTGMILSLPTNIPPSSVVVELSGFILTTNNGQFTLKQAFSNYIDNKFKGNQNFNIVGSTGDPLPDATPRTYTVGSEISAGIEVITTDAEQVTYVNGVINSGNNTGIIRRRYAKDLAGFITKSSQYGGIKLSDGSQLQALIDDIATNGVRITEDGSDVVVDVDLSVITNGFRFFGLSESAGAWDTINDNDSAEAYYFTKLLNDDYVDVLSSRSFGVTYTNNSKFPLDIYVSAAAASNSATVLEINTGGKKFVGSYVFATAAATTVRHTVKSGDTYVVNSAGGATSSIIAWEER